MLNMVELPGVSSHCEISGICHVVVEVCALVGRYTSLVGSW